jgi:hypothetical protein
MYACKARLNRMGWDGVQDLSCSMCRSVERVLFHVHSNLDSLEQQTTTVYSKVYF